MTQGGSCKLETLCEGRERMRINSGYVATPSPLQPPYHVGKYVNASAIPSHIWTFWADCPPKIILAFIKTWCARFGLLGN